MRPAAAATITLSAARGLAVSTMRGVYCFSVPAADADAGSWPRTFVAPNDSDEGIGVADVDGDGHRDITFTGGKDKTVKWAKNPGDGSDNWRVFTIGSFGLRSPATTG